MGQQSAAIHFETGGEITPAVIAELAEDAHQRISEFVSETPLNPSEVLSTGHTQVLIKDETIQPGSSFKDRGAGNAVLYHAEQGESSVVTASAGNHGRGVARAAAAQGIDATVFVPTTANETKKSAIKNLGADLVVEGTNFDKSLKKGLEVAKQRGEQFVHPFEDPNVIAGQATMALEVLKQSPDATHIVLPVGGGGLLAGVASVIKEHKENIQVVAAQVTGNRAYVDSLKAGHALKNQPVNSRFEGVAVGNIHPLTFSIARSLVDRTVVIEPTEVYRVLHDYRQEQGTLLELAGAVSPTAAQHLGRTDFRGQEAKIISIASGANPPKALSPWLNARARSQGWDHTA